MTFDDAVKFILDYEGGYVNDPNDPGGETKFGISKRSYPNLDITNLSIDHAKFIYREDYWNKVKGDWLPVALRLMVFDCAVNQGVTRSIKFLQKSLGLKEDGIFGPITGHAVRDCIDSDVLYRYSHLRLEAYVKNPQWGFYGKGWSKRLLDVAIISSFFAKGPSDKTPSKPLN